MVIKMKNKLILTGGSGFIGGNILKKINRECVKVYILGRDTPENMNIEDVFYKVDLSNFSNVEEALSEIKATHLIHLAWAVKEKNFAESFSNIEWIINSINLLNCFIKNSGKHFIGAGTCFEYDLTIKKQLSEISQCRPKTLYGKSKYELSKIAEKICLENEVRFVWARIFYPYGIGEEPRKLFSSVIESLKKNEFFECKNPKDILDYIHVSDIADDFIEFAFDNNIVGYKNICTGEEILVGEAVKYIAGKMSKDEYVIYEDKINFEKYIIGFNSKKRKSFYEKILEMIEVDYEK